MSLVSPGHGCHESNRKRFPATLWNKRSHIFMPRIQMLVQCFDCKRQMDQIYPGINFHMLWIIIAMFRIISCFSFELCVAPKTLQLLTKLTWYLQTAVWLDVVFLWPQQLLQSDFFRGNIRQAHYVCRITYVSSRTCTYTTSM